MPPSLPSRRQLLGGLGALTVAGSLGVAASGRSASAVATGKTQVGFWNLFSGGDGANLQTILAGFRKEFPQYDLRDATLAWGNPYYTKLAMAGTGGRSPEVGVLHLGRLTGFAPGTLLDPFDLDLLAKYGVEEKDFKPDLWKQAVVDGKLYAVPLDIHPQLNFYRKDVCEKAGLIGDDGKLVPIVGEDALFDALGRARKVTGKMQTLGLPIVLADFAWWAFLSFYAQTGGAPLLDAAATEITLDDDKAVRTLEFLHRLVKDGYVVPGTDNAAGFINGGAFVWEGCWSVPVYSGAKLDYGVTPMPQVFDKPAGQAASHAFVLPHQADRGGPENEAGYALIAYLIKNSTAWALGGHVPAFTPVRESAAYKELQPQAEYAAVMDQAVYDPPAWFSGSAGRLSANAGFPVSQAAQGQISAAKGLASVKAALQGLIDTPNPFRGADSVKSLSSLPAPQGGASR